VQDASSVFGRCGMNLPRNHPLMKFFRTRRYLRRMDRINGTHAAFVFVCGGHGSFADQLVKGYRRLQKSGEFSR
jgi:hypothetical protein